MNLLENIKQLCIMQGINLETLCNDLGFGEKAIYKWKKSSPKTETLQKVADYFNVSIDHLVYGFNRSLFTSTLFMLKNGRTLERFSKESNIDIADLDNYLKSTAKQKPSIEIIEKLVLDNPVAHIITPKEIYCHAGYDAPEKYETIEYVPSPMQKNELDEQEKELLRIFKTLSIKDKTLLLTRAYELEEQNK